MSMSLEDLANVDISMTSAAKKEQAISDIPAAAYVITNEMIRRSGVRSVAEALGLAPGVQVTRLSEYNWQVSLRGLNTILFNQLLVMIDGRSVYSPLMSGTFWHTIDTVFEDIERIEVIRGTSGTMWGGNAANGVVNIITKNSGDTQGHYVEVANGERNYQELNYRYGTTLSDKITARAFVKGITGDYYSINDDLWRNVRGGIRADYDDNARQITVQAGGFETKSDHDWFYGSFDNVNFGDKVMFNASVVDVYSRGLYASLDWFETVNETDYELHLWTDYNFTDEASAQGEFYSFDVDTLARTALNEKHELTSGAGLRVIHRRTEPYPDNFYSKMEAWGRYSNDPVGTDINVNGYIQLESQLSDKLTSTLGAKIEYFSLNDTVELQPQARLLYKYNAEQQFWVGAGRAVVTPSFVDTKTDMYQLSYNHPNEQGEYEITGVFISKAKEDLDNESVITIDAGHRFTPMPSLNIDSTVFYSQYDNTRMEDPNQLLCHDGNCIDGSNVEHKLPIYLDSYNDDLDVETFGFETAIRWTPFEALTINTNYTFMETNARCSGYAACENDTTPGYNMKYNNQPKHFVSMQSLWDFAPGWQLDLWYKYRSGVSVDSMYYDTPSISTVDLRLAWQQQPNWPRVELVVDGFGEAAYADQPGAYPSLEETIYFKASWNIQ
ncbi:TonB-dependent receptor plug domain-containing protein [Photobacterium japonica]|uniref:TonB-dependent receptor plug domain-containing protein n=1 Tax=Photobacterium japonica TaxID=2910235 RepID=UPI003D0F10B3